LPARFIEVLAVGSVLVRDFGGPAMTAKRASRTSVPRPNNRRKQIMVNNFNLTRAVVGTVYRPSGQASLGQALHADA
jgi:hypothetical protein